VEALIILEQDLKKSRQNARQLETQVMESTAQGSNIVEMALELQEVRESCRFMAESIHKKRAALGVGQRTALRRIQDDVFLQLRVNARTLKTRIRDRLRQRKFELEPLQRSYKHVKGCEVYAFPLSCIDSLTDQKLASSVEGAIKRREPGIAKLAKMYNDICNQMQSRVREGKVARNVALPLQIDLKKLFSLDVEDDIWQDVGLDDDDDGAVALWLEDSKTRNGIKNLLLLDRCLEEEVRLQKERSSLQAWMYEEWLTLKRAYTLSGKLSKFILGRNHVLSYESSYRRKCGHHLPA
jgi:hypothetical protein